MSPFDWIQLGAFIALLLFAASFMGQYMAFIFSDQKTRPIPFLSWLEVQTYRVCRINPYEEMNWKRYAKTLLVFNLLCFLVIFAVQILQKWLPLNPQSFPSPAWDLAFNTASSFTTNTNLQGYAGETTLSYFTQMAGLTVQNFLSAAVGNTVLIALIRGIQRKNEEGIGNFWNDLVKTIIYILLPLSIVMAILLISQGVVQSFDPYLQISTLEGGKQTIPFGPAASQVAIKQIGTNGGGFFNTNSAHPFENPTPFSNLLEVFAIMLIPAATTVAYGLLIGSKKKGWVFFLVILTVWLLGALIALYSEYQKNPILEDYPLLEGKETRFGVFNSVLWSISTTATSNGSTNAMLDSLSPLAGGLALFNILLEEIVFGGVGVGMCGMLMFTFLTVFLCGLMVGRTPEYQGKKIEKREIQWVMLSILTPSCLILIGSSIALALPGTLSSMTNQGPHGITEVLYSFSSASGNNGSTFAGLNTNTIFFNLVLGLIMILARLSILIPSLAIAGSLVRKRVSPSSMGTFATDTFLFGVLLLFVIIIMAALTFFPALCLGPIVEHYLMLQGRSF